MTASAGAFFLATFFKLFIAGIARISQRCFVLESILVQRTILFWDLHLLEKSQHTQRSLPLASEKHPASPQPEQQTHPSSSSSSSAELPPGSERKWCCPPVKFADIFLFTDEGECHLLPLLDTLLYAVGDVQAICKSDWRIWWYVSVLATSWKLARSS